MMFQLRLAAAIAAGLAAYACAAASVWPEVSSDLPADPQIHYGVLPNGLRYAVRHNAEPKGRVSIRLLVAAGSIEEREGERGIAHFIEHMAYRGTRQHPNGSLTSELQRLGVGFGPDSSAFTFWDHTIYQLELPDNNEATLREGLGVFREYARDISFDPALIERERDVILNELDTRDTPDSRSGQANLELLWPSSVQVARRPIGLSENIRLFKREDFVDFYDAWYRPERMAVVVVGDVDTDEAARVIAREMGEVAARGQPRPDVIADVPKQAGPPNIRVFSDAGVAGVVCTLEHPFADPVSPDTHAVRVQRLRGALALTILQRRVSKLAKSVDGKVVMANVGVSEMLPGWSLVSLGGSGAAKDWQAFMASLEQEQRRAFQFGFTEEEVALARSVFATSYSDAVRTSATWHSDWVATAIADAMLKGRVLATPACLSDDIAADLAATTPAQCREEYRRMWSKQSQHVFVSANSAFNVTSRQIADILNASRGVVVAKPAGQANVAFAYKDFGPPGKIISSRVISDLEITQAQFANGVRLNFKPTKFEAGSIVISLRVGTGALSEPKGRPGLELMANGIMFYGGLGRHSEEELRDALAGHALAVNFGVGSDSFEFTARCEPRDLELCLQLIAADLTDAAYRLDGLPQVQASMNSMYAGLGANPAGPIQMTAGRILSGGDSRFGTPSPAEFSRVTVDQVRSWIDPQLKHGPIELGVAGDTDWETVSSAVARTLGALPTRQEREVNTDAGRLNLKAKPDKTQYLFTTSPSLRLVALSRFCPVLDLKDIHMERRCRLLAQLLQERMRQRLRIELGAAYGFDANFFSVPGFPELSYFEASTTVAPVHAARANELIAEEIESLRRGRISDDEFERVKKPFMASREEDLRDNGYWSHTVLRDSQEHPERISDARDRQADCGSIQRSELAALAARYFKKGSWIQCTAFPRAASSFEATKLQPFK